MNKNISHCGSYLYENDKDIFLISLFAPALVREDLWALFAFNHEIAKIKFLVNDAALGRIRLQWWRDEIARIYAGGDIVDHEVLKPLSKAINAHNLPQEQFNRLLYAREFDLKGEAPASIKGLISYAEYTTLPLLVLALHICAIDVEQELTRAVAVNFALARILRFNYRDKLAGTDLLPNDLAISDIVASKPENSKPDNILLKSFEALSNIYWRQLKSLNYDINSPLLQREAAFKALRLWWKVIIL